MPTRLLTAATLLPMLLFAVGCRVDATSTAKGDNVKIATPFGGIAVKTDDNAVATETGLPAYPGAVVDHEKNSDGKHDTGAADVNMSFGGFQLRVKAIGYRTTDAPAKVVAFYRSGLARFGTVIQCSGEHPVGTPTKTPDGLTCSDADTSGQAHFNKVDLQHGTELKAGSKQHQHIVSIDPDGSGTKFGLVALDLPGKFPFGDDSDDSSKSGKSQQPE